MQKLTNKEEQIMQVIWKLERAFVKEVVAELPDPKPHYNTVSTVIRILEEKGFVAHRSFGNSHQYYPLIARGDYRKSAVGEILENFFENSYLKMVTYFAQEEKLSEGDLNDILDLIKKKKS